jgi:hypothetical protein
MARVDADRVVRTALSLGPLIHADRHPPGDHVEQVRDRQVSDDRLVAEPDHE